MISAPPASPTPPPSSTPERTRWLSALAVLIAVVVIALSGPVTAAILSEPGPPVDATPHVRIFPLRGWTLTGRLRGHYTGIRLSNGNASLDVVSPSGPIPAHPVADFILRS